MVTMVYSYSTYLFPTESKILKVGQLQLREKFMKTQKGNIVQGLRAHRLQIFLDSNYFLSCVMTS